MRKNKFEFDGKTVDFIDFGASKGGSIEFGQDIFGGTHGVGLDIDGKKIVKLKSLGFSAIQGDIKEIGLPAKSVRFVVASHFLEHLPNLAEVKTILLKAEQVAQEFICIFGPNFDDDSYLSSIGLRFFWSHWRGHRCHLKTWELKEILCELGLYDYEFYMSCPVTSWRDPSLHSIESPEDQFDYQPGIHPEKPCPIIDKPVYREFFCIVKLGEIQNWDIYLERLKGKRKLVSYQPRNTDKNKNKNKNALDQLRQPYLSQKNGRKRLGLQKMMAFYPGLVPFYHQHLRYALYLEPSNMTVLVDSMSRGLEVLSLAVEFPGVFFSWCTKNVSSSRKQRFDFLVTELNIENVQRIEGLDFLESSIDLYCSFNTLCYMDDELKYMRRILEINPVNIFCFEDFAPARFNRDQKRCDALFERTGKYRFGYDAEGFRRIFGYKGTVAGALWKDTVRQWNLAAAINPEPDCNDEYMEMLLGDVREHIPIYPGEAQSIWYMGKFEDDHFLRLIKGT